MREPKPRLTSVLFRRFLAVFLAAHLFPPAVSAFKPDIHEEISREALARITRGSAGAELRFSSAAVDEVVGANRDVDCGGSSICLCPACQKDSSRHFDNEAFATSSERLYKLRQSIVSAIATASPDGAVARRDLGAALHTVQDYYAHSNWVEKVVPALEIDERLGREIFSGPDPGASSCPTRSNAMGGIGRSMGTSGWFGVPDFCAWFAAPGKCVHGGFPLCAGGISKDVPGRAGFDTARAMAVQASLDFVDQILNDAGVASDIRAARAILGL